MFTSSKTICYLAVVTILRDIHFVRRTRGYATVLASRLLRFPFFAACCISIWSCNQFLSALLFYRSYAGCLSMGTLPDCRRYHHVVVQRCVHFLGLSCQQCEQDKPTFYLSLSWSFLLSLQYYFFCVSFSFLFFYLQFYYSVILLHGCHPHTYTHPHSHTLIMCLHVHVRQNVLHSWPILKVSC